jgi:hypothetical protein
MLNIIVGIDLERSELAATGYTKGFFVGSDKDWYHGDLGEEEAEQALKASGCDCFLIRQSRGVLVLSLVHGGEFHHIAILSRPGWYELENGTAQYSFPELEELVDYYCSYPLTLDSDMKLGQICDKEDGGERGVFRNLLHSVKKQQHTMPCVYRLHALMFSSHIDWNVYEHGWR